MVLVALLAVARSARPDPAPTVYAAASLRTALRAIGGGADYSFAGSGTLQHQIERGAPADVFASASPKEAHALYRAGRCRRPVAFATNRLVMIVPAKSTVSSVERLRRGRLRVAVGAPGVPVGAYTRTLLQRLGLTGVLASNAVSEEPDVSSVSAKVALGSADAGFVYHTDALATHGRTREVALPARAQPAVEYQLCAVRRAGADGAGARDFIARLTGAEGRRVLARAGFGLPPRR
ncbi:MAG: molybdenum transporter, periplasmic molybdate-binding protein [Conexibacter sp.]|nr:molybdenum transporter, periplasmic molybdate-binding protein [Conexibacter sp.]